LNLPIDLVKIAGLSTQEVEMQNINKQPARHPLMGISDVRIAFYAYATDSIIATRCQRPVSAS